MKEYEIVAVKHDERRNGKRCAMYWCIESDPESERDFHSEIYDHWICREIPKRISKILETAPEDPEDYGLKRGIFILTLEKPVTFEDYGHVHDFKNVLSINIKKD